MRMKSGENNAVKTLLLVFFSVAAYTKEIYSPYVDQSYPTDVYWGDTHLHTNLSVDANAWGKNERLGTEMAYRFARGETVASHNGMKVRLRRPLDFLVIADHAFNLGVMVAVRASDPVLLKTEVGRRAYDRFREIEAITDRAAHDAAFSEFTDSLFKENILPGQSPYLQSVWQQVTASADHYNDPGKFTAFIGYEWTSSGQTEFLLDDMSSVGNLHRVVIFKDSADKANQIAPFSLFDSSNPEDLWRFLGSYEQKTGGKVLAIPHNGNTSRGEMFALTDFKGRPLNAAYAKTRSRWEPLYETVQTKGDSESHPALSPTDEFADYETWHSWNAFSMEGIKTEGWIDRKQSEYARSALKLGLGQQAILDLNPFKFGLIGSTDSHTALATADENNYWGKVAFIEPSPDRMFMKGAWQLGAAGYAAVWAEENTREALFAAMKRKEVYATTGPRIEVRFFGGWEFSKGDALRADIALTGYAKGVPMGGDLTNAPDGKTPSFLIRAVKDPDGAYLDRVQVIKGWRSADGELHEKIYNVALSDDRKEDKNGKALSVGNSVDVKNASYTNSIGDPELAVVWQDPDFDKDELAFYYLRVLEIPTPRWTAYDAKFFDIQNIPEEVPIVTQERAYSSPIWYTP